MLRISVITYHASRYPIPKGMSIYKRQPNGQYDEEDFHNDGWSFIEHEEVTDFKELYEKGIRNINCTLTWNVNDTTNEILYWILNCTDHMKAVTAKGTEYYNLSEASTVYCKWYDKCEYREWSILCSQINRIYPGRILQIWFMRKDMKFINALQNLQGPYLHSYGTKIVMPPINESRYCSSRNDDDYDMSTYDDRSVLSHVYIICTRRYDQLIKNITDIFGERSPEKDRYGGCSRRSVKYEDVHFSDRNGYYPINARNVTCILYNFNRWKQWMATLPKKIKLTPSPVTHNSVSTETDKRSSLTIESTMYYESFAPVEKPLPITWRWGL